MGQFDSFNEKKQITTNQKDIYIPSGVYKSLYINSLTPWAEYANDGHADTPFNLDTIFFIKDGLIDTTQSESGYSITYPGIRYSQVDKLIHFIQYYQFNTLLFYDIGWILDNNYKDYLIRVLLRINTLGIVNNAITRSLKDIVNLHQPQLTRGPVRVIFVLDKNHLTTYNINKLCTFSANDLDASSTTYYLTNYFDGFNLECEYWHCGGDNAEGCNDFCSWILGIGVTNGIRDTAHSYDKSLEAYISPNWLDSSRYYTHSFGIWEARKILENFDVINLAGDLSDNIQDWWAFYESGHKPTNNYCCHSKIRQFSGWIQRQYLPYLVRACQGNMGDGTTLTALPFVNFRVIYYTNNFMVGNPLAADQNNPITIFNNRHLSNDYYDLTQVKDVFNNQILNQFIWIYQEWQNRASNSDDYDTQGSDPFLTLTDADKGNLNFLGHTWFKYTSLYMQYYKLYENYYKLNIWPQTPAQLSGYDSQYGKDWAYCSQIISKSNSLLLKKNFTFKKELFTSFNQKKT